MPYAKLSSNQIHTPSSVSEVGSILAKNQEAILWAGGTYLMTRPNFYPSKSALDVIDLSKVKELQRISRSERYVSIGAMTSAAHLADAGRLVLPKILLDALTSIHSTLVRRQITIGGTLCIPDYRLAIPTALSTLHTVVELRIFLKNGKSTTKRLPVSRLYDNKGKVINMDGRFLLTHVRIGLESGNYHKFLIVGDPMQKPTETVIIAFQAERSATFLGKVQMTITFPNMAFFINKEIIGQLTGIALPITPLQIHQITENLRSELKKAYPNLGMLQQERAYRMFESILYDINTLYLQGGEEK